MEKIKTLSEKKSTTVVGGMASVAGILVALIPSDVKASCFDSIHSSDNPALVGGLLSLGLALTFIGPSLAKKASNGNEVN